MSKQPQQPVMPNNPVPPYEQYLITSSENVSILIRLRDVVLTVALWVLYFYFIRESFPFVADLYHWARDGFSDMAKYPNLEIMSMIQSYGQVAAVMATIYLGWAIYNMLRFRGSDRRKLRAPVAPEDLANMYGFSPETVAAWQGARTLLIHHDAEGHLTDVKIVKKK